MQIHFGSIDYLILLTYFAFVLGIGWVLKRYMKGSVDFFQSGISLHVLARMLELLLG